MAEEKSAFETLWDSIKSTNSRDVTVSREAVREACGELAEGVLRSGQGNSKVMVRLKRRRLLAALEEVLSKKGEKAKEVNNGEADKPKPKAEAKSNK